jgi:hypothetical protein
MALLSMSTRSKELLHSMRPLFLGIPTFVVISIVAVWSLARLASWVFALLKVAK